MSLLAAIAFGPAKPGKRASLYAREIAPHEKKLVWYRFNDKLPDVSPPEPEDRSEAVRAEAVNPRQTIVSRSPRNDPDKQMTFAPAPDLKIQPELAAPNLMAFEPPKPPEPPKLFVPPPEVAPSTGTPVLEDAPALALAETALAQLPAPRVPKLAPKAFVPPVPEPKRTEAPQLQAGEFRIEPAPMSPIPFPQLPLPARPKPKVFTPPSEPVRQAAAAPILSGAPALAQAPNSTKRAGLQIPVAAPARPQPKRFTPPQGSTSPGAPAAPALENAPSLTAAVVGLNPSDRAIPVLPDASRSAQFSAAPEISRSGGAGAPSESARIVVPGLTIRGDTPKRESLATMARITPTSRENLLAAARPLIASAARAPPRASTARVGGGPDPRFEGRIVYTVAIQMPNVTSFSGSWILWYAERQGLPGEAPEIAPPGPLRKVDPIYDRSAEEERVEGKVQLSAVIHTDGFVYGIKVLSGLDPRLDTNAMTALRKWEFEPARRAGVPVDVDIVIEIPFRLRPKQ